LPVTKPKNTMSLIVIEGLDGSGKSTQMELLRKYLDNHGIGFEYLHFPRVDQGIFGTLVSRFLRGDLGKIDQVDPYLIGLIYAGDRNDAKELVNEWTRQGKLVIIDRYVYSNMAFQGAKLTNRHEKLKLREWLDQLEFNYYRIPKPELSIFLDVPFSFTTQSLTNQRSGDDRQYLEGKQDIHEADLDFQEKVRQEYLDLIKSEPGFELVECFDSDCKMLAPADIFGKIIGCLAEHGIV
jgi:dTMP kinase